MRLATFTLFGFIMICPVCAFPQTTLWDVAPINKGLFKNQNKNSIEKKIHKINNLIEKQKEKLKNAFYLSRKPIFNKFRKKQKFEEEEPLISEIQTSPNIQIGGFKTSTFTFIQFILLISGGLSKFLVILLNNQNLNIFQSLTN